MTDWRYLFSFANRYPYVGIIYYTADAFFFKELEARPDIVCSDKVGCVFEFPIRLKSHNISAEMDDCLGGSFIA